MKEADNNSFCVVMRRELNGSTDYGQLIKEMLEFEQTRLIIMMADPQVFFHSQTLSLWRFPQINNQVCDSEKCQVFY